MTRLLLLQQPAIPPQRLKAINLILGKYTCAKNKTLLCSLFKLASCDEQHDDMQSSRAAQIQLNRLMFMYMSFRSREKFVYVLRRKMSCQQRANTADVCHDCVLNARQLHVTVQHHSLTIKLDVLVSKHVSYLLRQPNIDQNYKYIWNDAPTILKLVTLVKLFICFLAETIGSLSIINIQVTPNVVTGLERHQNGRAIPCRSSPREL